VLASNIASTEEKPAPFAKSCSLFSSQKRLEANQVSLMIVQSRGEEFLAYPNCDRVFTRMENKKLGGF
jgi:hypothetical protein